MLEQPGSTWSTEVGGEGKAGGRAKAVRVSAGQPINDPSGAGVLPHDGPLEWLSGCRVPDEKGLALVGDSHRSQVSGGQVGCGECRSNHRPRVFENLDGIVFDPPGPREVLCVGSLGRCHHRPSLINDQEPSAGSSLVESANKGHSQTVLS